MMDEIPLHRRHILLRHPVPQWVPSNIMTSGVGRWERHLRLGLGQWYICPWQLNPDLRLYAHYAMDPWQHHLRAEDHFLHHVTSDLGNARQLWKHQTSNKFDEVIGMEKCLSNLAWVELKSLSVLITSVWFKNAHLYELRRYYHLNYRMPSFKNLSLGGTWWCHGTISLSLSEIGRSMGWAQSTFTHVDIGRKMVGLRHKCRIIGCTSREGGQHLNMHHWGPKRSRKNAWMNYSQSSEHVARHHVLLEGLFLDSRCFGCYGRQIVLQSSHPLLHLLLTCLSRQKSEENV